MNKGQSGKEDGEQEDIIHTSETSKPLQVEVKEENILQNEEKLKNVAQYIDTLENRL